MRPHPLEGIAPKTLVRAAVLCAMAAAGCMAFLVPAGDRLKSPASPRGIVSFELAGSPKRMEDILSAWGPERKWLAHAVTWVDFPFIAAYAGLLTCAALGLARLARMLGRTRELGMARLAAWAMTAAAPLDAAENVLGLRVLSGSLSPETGLMALAAGLKFALIAAGFGLMAGAWITLRRVGTRS